jgi:hypothetical protein
MSLLSYATRFEILPSLEVQPKLFTAKYFDTTSDITVALELRVRNKGLWVVLWRGDCLNRDLTWEYEPLPSNRSDEFLARTRFTLAEALALLGRSDLRINHTYDCALGAGTRCTCRTEP